MTTSAKTEDPTTEPEVAEKDRRRKLIGLISGPIAAAVLYFSLPADLNNSASFVAATAALMAIWWMTEAIPLPATALVPLVVFPFLTEFERDPETEEIIGEEGRIGIAPIASPYADEIIFLFMGGFILALAMQKCNLHRRFALAVLSLVGNSPAALIGGFMIATAFITMWVSNTATAIMMLPVGLAVLGLVTNSNGDGKDGAEPDRNFATALMLGIAYAASIGSVATLIGTPPNALMAGFLRDNYDIHIGFAQWMMVGLPLAIVFLVVAWVVLTKLVFPPKIKKIAGSRELIKQQLRDLGAITRAEWTVMGVFFTAASSWIIFGILRQNDDLVERFWFLDVITDGGIAIAIAILLFILPVDNDGNKAMDWATTKDLPWGILLLFGGGLSLSSQFSQTDLSVWIGEQVGFLEGVPLWVLILVVAATVLLLTELTSNTATAATFMPVMAGVAIGLGVPIMALIIPTALAATFAFMLPVATPPNAIVFGSGYVRIGEMVKGGVVLNISSLVIIMVGMYAIANWVFSIGL